MDALALLGWALWMVTGGLWLKQAWPRVPPSIPPPPAWLEDPVTDGWHCRIHDERGAVQSLRKVREGNIPTRIQRGHGNQQEWYRLSGIEGQALIYTPDDPTHQ